MNKRYHWQPELSVAIIYWSVTLIILFYSLTLSLENTRPYWKSNLVMVFFFVFLGIGCLRWLRLREDHIQIHYSRFWLNRQVYYQDMQNVEFSKNALEFYYEGRQYHFMFRKKTLDALANSLEKILPDEKIVKLPKEQRE